MVNNFVHQNGSGSLSLDTIFASDKPEKMGIIWNVAQSISLLCSKTVKSSVTHWHGRFKNNHFDLRKLECVMSLSR